MRFLQKFLVVIVGGWGLLFTLIFAILLMSYPQPNQTQAEFQKEREENILGLVVLGLPPLGLAGWLVWDLISKDKKQKLEQEKQLQGQLNETFFHLLEEHQGQITVLRLVMESKLETAEAQKYLDRKAIEFNADFETSEDGEIIYHFHL